jgi:hypothetical protein
VRPMATCVRAPGEGRSPRPQPRPGPRFYIGLVPRSAAAAGLFAAGLSLALLPCVRSRRASALAWRAGRACVNEQKGRLVWRGEAGPLPGNRHSLQGAEVGKGRGGGVGVEGGEGEGQGNGRGKRRHQAVKGLVKRLCASHSRVLGFAEVVEVPASWLTGALDAEQQQTAAVK